MNDAPSIWFPLCALLALLPVFGGGYLVCRALNNYGFVDAIWSFSFAPVAVGYAWFGTGMGSRRIAVGALAILWSCRLGSHLLQRLVRQHPDEDGRYLKLRQDWGDRFQTRMPAFFFLQAASVIVLSGPFLYPVFNHAAHFHWLEALGVALWLLALGGEALADAQLEAFKRKPVNRGAVCAVGLWRYSRHPNYFFEWLLWVALALFASASPWGWLAWLSPALMLLLLFRVTGIPLAEEQSLRSKGEAYRRYQASTPAFLPWFPRRIP